MLQSGRKAAHHTGTLNQKMFEISNCQKMSLIPKLQRNSELCYNKDQSCWRQLNWSIKDTVIEDS